MPLPSPSVPPLVRAPVRAAQFVIEMVGPRSVPTARAAELLRPDWRAALGSPELWCLAPADAAWKPLRALTRGSYDSVALAWDLVSPKGEMAPAAAEHLLGLAERFANALGRRAVPLTAPSDVAGEARRVRKAKDGLDAGVTALLVAPRPVRVAEFGRVLESTGLAPFGDEWGWFDPGHPEPLFAATPFDAPQTDGLTLGFRLPRSPDPAVALEGMLGLADELARTGLDVLDEDRRPLTPALRESMRENVRIGTRALGAAGLRPGSWAALKVFS